jgi:gamma-glutamyltranspeptidase
LCCILATPARATLGTLRLESNLYDLVAARLRALGHKVESANGEDMGGYQAIWFVPDRLGSLAGRRDRATRGRRIPGSVG